MFERLAASARPLGLKISQPSLNQMPPLPARLPLAPLRQVDRRRRPTAFTLVETALALGIVAFAMIPLVGLLPVGLQLSKEASDLTVAAQIAQRLTGMVQQSDDTSAMLRTGDSPLMKNYYAFDNEGQPVSAQSGAQTQVGSGAAVYSAAILSVQTAEAPPPASLADVPKAVTLVIQVVSDPAQRLKSATPKLKLTSEIKSQPILLPVYLPDRGI